ncbi:MAG: hypothetical protein AAGG75_01125 [Bacteroidota bacterium]
MITLPQLVLYVGIFALLMTIVVAQLKQVKSYPVSYLQNFAGGLFIFSGWVKAIDPLGTAYKMEQYFGEFESTFEGTWMSFLAPMFPALAEYAILFSVFMIVFEIVLGVMLLMGARPKLTAWAFLLLVGFFTFLTGFTYLTGYVPQDVNFFEFSNWGPYVKTNMKVTDCGCFGDFLKLEPKVSFFKDVFLLVPSFIFVFMWNKMHQLSTTKVRNIAIIASTVGLTIYCLSNYMWDLPHTDFRPFNVGKDVAKTRQIEQESAGNVKLLAYNLTNKTTKEEVNLPYEQFLKEFKSYPKEEWEYEQIRSEPTVPATKISDFAISDIDENDVTEDILNDPNYSLMVVCYKFYYEVERGTAMVNDTSFVVDTVMTVDAATGEEMVQLVRSVDQVSQREVSDNKYLFNEGYRQLFTEKVNPFVEAAEKSGMNVYGVVGGAGPDIIDDFRHATQSAYPFHTADDILLKTIIRSNPGVVLWKNGQIIDKWHISKLPSFGEVEKEILK